MTYPNAHEGVKKLVTAEALQIISAGLGIIAAILGVVALAGATNALLSGSEASAAGAVGAGIGTLLCSIGIIVLSIIAEIFMLIGLKKASTDEPKNFNIAFIAAIAVLIASVLSGVLAAIPVIGSILKVVTNIGSIFVFIYTVYGIKELATALGRNDVVSLGNIVIIVETIMLILNCIATFVGGILAIITAIVALICYIIYLVYLTKAKAMLAEG